MPFYVLLVERRWQRRHRNSDLVPEAVGAADDVGQTISRGFCGWGVIVAGRKEVSRGGKVDVGIGNVAYPGYSSILQLTAVSVEGAEHVEQYCVAGHHVFKKVKTASFRIVNTRISARAAGWTRLWVLEDVQGSGRDTGQGGALSVEHLRQLPTLE